MSKSHKNRSCGGQVTRRGSSRPSIHGNPPHLRPSPRVKSFRPGFWVIEVSNFYADRCRVRSIEERRQRRTCVWIFNFLLGGQVFYRTSAVLFIEDGESEKIKVGLLKNSCSCLSSYLRSLFYHVFFFFYKNKKVGPYPTIKPLFLIHFWSQKALLVPSPSPFFYMHKFSLLSFPTWGQRLTFSLASFSPSLQARFGNLLRWSHPIGPHPPPFELFLAQMKLNHGHDDLTLLQAFKCMIREFPLFFPYSFLN